MSVDLIGSTSAAGRRRRAGVAAGKGVEDVFSISTYEGDQTIGLAVETSIPLANNTVAGYSETYQQDESGQNTVFDGTTIDTNGNIYSIASQQNIPRALFITKKSMDGTEIWKQSITNSGGYGFSQAHCVISGDHIYVCGIGRAGNTSGVVVLKLQTSDGVMVNNTSVAFMTVFGDVCADSSGDIYLAGYGNDGLAKVVKLSGSNLALQWKVSHYWNINETNRYHGITAMGNSIYLAGEFRDTSPAGDAGIVKISQTDGSIEESTRLYYNQNYASYAYDITNDGTYVYLAVNLGTPGLAQGNIIKYNSTLGAQARCAFNDRITIEKIIVRGDDLIFSGVNDNTTLQYDNRRYIAKIDKDLSISSVVGRTLSKEHTITELEGNANYQCIVYKQVDQTDNLYENYYLVTTDLENIAPSNFYPVLPIQMGGEASATWPLSPNGTITAGTESALSIASTTYSQNSPTEEEDIKVIKNEFAYPIVEDANGGLIWIKGRHSLNDSHILVDTERGLDQIIVTNSTTDQIQTTNHVLGTMLNGFILGASTDVNRNTAASTGKHVAWSFKKEPRFFDIVTYTGDGAANQWLDHNLGQKPGWIVTKKITGGNTHWELWARVDDDNYAVSDGTVTSFGFNTGNAAYVANSAGGGSQPNIVNAANDTQFNAGLVGSVSNIQNEQYVAYLFAHHEGDGVFGPNEDQDIIKCGSYLGNGATGIRDIDIGFEPQFIIFTNITDPNSVWHIYDNRRQWSIGNRGAAKSKELATNTSDGDTSAGNFGIWPSPNGITTYTNNSEYNAVNKTYIYMAIRRGPMAVPTDPKKVFAIESQANESPSTISNFPVDMATRFWKLASGNNNYQMIIDRFLHGEYKVTSVADTVNGSSGMVLDYDDGWGDAVGGTTTDLVSHMFRRAPKFFDMTWYVGDGTSTAATKTIPHQLEAVPEMIWLKYIDFYGSGAPSVPNWHVYHKDLLGEEVTPGNPQTYPNVGMYLDESNSFLGRACINSLPTETEFVVRNYNTVNKDGALYQAYLWATLPGISKVGSFLTGDGTAGSITIDCGFTTGARYVMIKDVRNSGSWYVVDTYRGITTGNDPLMKYDGPAANEITSVNGFDPHPSGFIINSNLYTPNTKYIFYAVA